MVGRPRLALIVIVPAVRHPYLVVGVKALVITRRRCGELPTNAMK
jgi:hypothetical protein